MSVCLFVCLFVCLCDDNSSKSKPILMPLGTITKGVKQKTEFNFGDILSSGCRDNRENVVKIVIFCINFNFLFSYIKVNTTITRVKINRFRCHLARLLTV
jgi:hypothetical protein